VNVKETTLGVATYLQPNAALVEENLGDLRKAVQAAARSASVHIVVDLSLVPFLDSAALEYLLDLSVAQREAGGSLRLASPSAVGRDVLAMTRLDRTIAVYQDLESAGRSFV
jgi:anti-anti-sigma factor